MLAEITFRAEADGETRGEPRADWSFGTFVRG
jgi:hypothetical protein